MRTVLALLVILCAAGLAGGQDAGGALIAKLPNGGDERLQDVAFSPDGRLLAAGYGFHDDGGVTIWEVASRKRVATLLGGARSEAGIERVAFSPDGRLFAAASDEGRLMLWTVGAWHSHKTLLAREADTADLVFSPDSTRLAFATEEAALLYDLRAGRATVVAKKAERDDINGVSFTPDGRQVVVFGDRSIRVWDVAAKRTVKVFEDAKGSFFGRLSPDGTRVVAGGGSIYGEKSVEVRAFPEGRRLHTLSDFRNGLFAVAISNSGKLFALAGGTYGGEGSLSLWDMREARELGFASFGSFPIQGVAFSPDDRLLAAASEDGFVLLYDVERLRGPSVEKQDYTLCAEVSSEGGKTFLLPLSKTEGPMSRGLYFHWGLEVSNPDALAAAVGSPVALHDWSIESSAARDRARVAGFRPLLSGGPRAEAVAEHIVYGMAQNPNWDKGYVAKIYADGSFVAANSSGRCLSHGHLRQLKTDFQAVKKRLLGRGLLAVPKEPLVLGISHFRTHFIEVFDGGVPEMRTDADSVEQQLGGAPSTKREAFRRVFEQELPFINSLLGAGGAQEPAKVAGPSRRKKLSP